MNFESTVREILPTIDDDTCHKVVSKLVEIGVETVDDLSIVVEQDLVEVLPCIKARKLVHSWKLLGKDLPTSTLQSPTTSKQLTNEPTNCSEQQASFNQPATLQPLLERNWADNFELPMESMSADLKNTLVDGRRPNPKIRRELVKVTVDKMVAHCQRPLKKHSDAVARKLVAKFPSLIDLNLETGQILGTGFESLAVQLKYRVENVNRKPYTANGIDHTQDDQECVGKKKKNSYGCVNHEPRDIPGGQTLESLLEKQSELVRKFGEGERAWELDFVNERMDATFSLQRKDINKYKSILELKTSWPFLFEESGMLLHFRKLMSIDFDSACQIYRQGMEICGCLDPRRFLTGIYESQLLGASG